MRSDEFYEPSVKLSVLPFSKRLMTAPHFACCKTALREIVGTKVTMIEPKNITFELNLSTMTLLEDSTTA